MGFMDFTSSRPEIAHKSEKAFLDKGMIIAAIFLLDILFFSSYFDKISDFFTFEGLSRLY